MSDDDWEDWDNDDKQIESNNTNDKFKDEQVVDKDKEIREQKERAEEKRILKEEQQKKHEEKKKNEKDYEQMYNKRIGKDVNEEAKVMSAEELRKQNPDMSEAQINDMISRQSEQKIGDSLFVEEEAPKSKKQQNKYPFTVEQLKGEKAYKQFGKEVGEYIAKQGQSHNHIPRFFSSMFHELSDKVTIAKMRNIVKDFDDRLKAKEKEEKEKKDAEKKLEKKSSKKNKKTAIGGVSKALQNNQTYLDDVFTGAYDDYGEGEGDYYGEGEGDQYVDYGRDEIDFM